MLDKKMAACRPDLWSRGPGHSVTWSWCSDS